MKVDITYPVRGKRKLHRHDVIGVVKWPFMLAAYICPILNIVLGGPAWSVVVLWSLWIIWSQVLSPDLVEYNRISQSIKLITNACVLLILIDTLLSPGWAVEVVPIVCFSGLIITAILLFTDLRKQRQNLLPLLLLSAVSIVSSVVGLILWNTENRWSMIVMGALAIALLAACFIVLGGGLLNEFRKRFHTK